ncbi:MAG: rod shape-determining protein MreC [Nitrospirota bacterium]
MTYQSKQGYLFDNNLLNIFFSNSYTAVKSITDTIKRPFESITLREEENKKLKRQVDDLILEKKKYQEVILENRRLRELLSLREKQNNYVTSAEIIARGVDHFANTLIINKGRRDGVEKDMSAITPKGLAGKIFNVSGSFSRLLLLTDINFSASVRMQDSRKEGIISGTGTKKCILKYVPYEEEIKTGDIIITSGLDMLFPPGIPVGYVSKVDNKGAGGHFQHIEVIPFQDNTKLEEVIIVK